MSDIANIATSILHRRANVAERYNDILRDNNFSAFPHSIFSHFVFGIPDEKINDPVYIKNCEHIDFSIPVNMYFRVFGETYIELEEEKWHFTKLCKEIMIDNNFTNYHLLYMVFNRRYINRQNDMYCIRSNTCHHYDMDFDDTFDNEIIQRYIVVCDDDEDDITVQYVLPIITGFKLSYDDIDNAIICDMEIYE